MKKISLIALILFLFSLSAGVVLADSPEATGESWLGIAIFNPIQYPDQSFSIRGVRLNAIYAVNQDLIGIDYGVLFPFNYLRGDLTGVQLGIYNEVGNKATGLQWGLANNTKGDMSGVQLGLANFSDGYQKGVQLGFWNEADHISGLQLGFINKTRSLYGVQLGLFNMKQELGPGIPKSFPMRGFPIINWTF